jgi:hypothetical protein
MFCFSFFSIYANKNLAVYLTEVMIDREYRFAPPIDESIKKAKKQMNIGQQHQITRILSCLFTALGSLSSEKAIKRK